MFTKLAALSRENTELKAEIAELKGQVEGFEKRANAEAFLLDLRDNPSAPIQFRPHTPEDFIEKRAMLEEHGNLDNAGLAVKMASRQDFEIGDVVDAPIQPETGEGQANAIFNDWLGQLA